MKLSLDGCKLLLIHVVLALVATAMVLPFTWMVLASLKRLQEIGLDSWIPTVFQWENYRDVFTMKGVQFGRWYWNSILVAAWVTFLQVFTSSLAAFSFSRLKWKGRDLVFLLYLATMMLPSLVMMIPNYQNMIYLGLVNTLQGLILPSAFSAFGTFLIRQFMMNIPSSLDEAAEIDGANRWQTLWKVTIPNVMPSITICTFLTLTNSFKLFDQNLALTGGQPYIIQSDGSAIKTTEMLALNIYNTFYGQNVNSRGTAQAKAVLFFLLVAAIGLIQLRATRKKEVQQ